MQDRTNQETTQAPSVERVAKVTNAKKTGRNSWQGTCPCHDDGAASLTITRGDSVPVIAHCHAGCDPKDIHRALADRGAPVFVDRPMPTGGRPKRPRPALKPLPRQQASEPRPTVKRKTIAVYEYQDEIGTVVSQAIRKEPKGFAQAQIQNGEVIWNMHGAKIVPYHLPEVIEAIDAEQTVFVVEGEKDVESLAAIGIVGTCNAGGAGKWTAEHSVWLQDAIVVIIPDNDDAGRAHAEKVTASLSGIARSVRTVELEGLEEKGDVSDWLDAGGTREQLDALVMGKPVAVPVPVPVPVPVVETIDPPRKTIIPAEIDYWNLPDWPDPVDAETVLDELRGKLRDYSILPEHADVAIALWILFSHSHDCFQISPLLAIESPEKRCGKSFLLDLIELLTPRADVTGNISVSAAFRLCDELHPTFIWDEVKRFMTSDKQELIGLLESGYRRRSAWVRRTEAEGRAFKVKKFSTWAPKCVALIGNVAEIADTLEDRSIRIRMRRKMPSENCLVIRQDRIGPFTDVNRRAQRWASDNMELVRATEPDLPECLHDRARDNWRPLMAIAELAGPKWIALAREAAVFLSAIKDTEESGGALLLRHIKIVFDAKGARTITPTDLVTALTIGEEAAEWPWGQWYQQRHPIKARGVAKMLKHYGIHSRKSGGRCYHRSDFEDSWERYQ